MINHLVPLCSNNPPLKHARILTTHQATFCLSGTPVPNISYSIIYLHDVPNIDCQTSDFMPWYLCEDEVNADGQRSLSLFDTGRAWRPTFCRSKGCQVWPIGIHRYPSVILGIPDRFGPKISIIAFVSWRFWKMFGTWRSRVGSWSSVRSAEEVLHLGSGQMVSIGRMGQLLTAWVTRVSTKSKVSVHLGPPRPGSPVGNWGLLESVLCAAGANPASGLHPKHAYSILDVRKAVPLLCGIPSWTNQLRGQSAWDTGYSSIGIGSDGMWWVPTFSMMSSRTERCVACGVMMKISATLEELHFLITYPLVI